MPLDIMRSVGLVAALAAPYVECPPAAAADPRPASASPPAPGPRDRGGRITIGPNIQVSRDRNESPHTEVILAADPGNSDRLLAGSMLQYEPEKGFFGLRCIAYVSRDGGKTWQVSLEPARGKPPLDTQLADPDVVFGLDGAAYFGHMVRRKLPAGEGATMMLHRSADGGLTWEASPFVDAETRIDRPFLAFDRTGGPYRGQLYYKCNIRPEALGGTGGTQYALGLFYSTDGGRSFSPPTPQRVRYAGMDNVLPGTSNSAVLSDGTVILLYFLQAPAFGAYADLYNKDPGYKSGKIAKYGIHFERTLDGGRSIAPHPPVTPQPGQQVQQASVYGAVAPWFRPQNTVDTGFPWIAVDPGSSRFKDRLYVIWDEERDGANRIMLSTSSDKGLSWTAPSKVSDLPEPREGRKSGRVYMPNVAVNRDGIVGVTWYDTRHVGAKRGWDVHFTTSMDGGVSWLPSVRVSEVSTIIDEQEHQRSARGGIPEGVGLSGVGDTTGLAADARGAFHLLWVDNRTGRRQVWAAKATVAGSEK